MIAATVAAAYAFMRVAGGGGAVPLPDSIEALLGNDDLAYPIHASIGGALDRVGGSAPTAGVQWFKAAAHVRSAGELERAADGIAGALRRDGAGREAEAALCAARSFSNHKQVAAVTRAGLACDGRYPSLLLSAAATPSRAAPGGSVSVDVAVASATTIDGIVDVAIHDPSGATVFRRWFGGQQLDDARPVTYAVVWHVPTGPSGTYVVVVGVFGPDWNGLLALNYEAALIEID